MSFRAEVREKLNGVDVKPFLKKNDFSGMDYLNWADCWQLLTNEYPNTEWPSFREEWLPDKSVMVHCDLEITGEGTRPNVVRQTMSLPVMIGKDFHAIENPSARQISDTQMRCFVKCAAVCGLGLVCWARFS